MKPYIIFDNPASIISKLTPRRKYLLEWGLSLPDAAIGIYADNAIINLRIINAQIAHKDISYPHPDLDYQIILIHSQPFTEEMRVNYDTGSFESHSWSFLFANGTQFLARTRHTA